MKVTLEMFDTLCKFYEFHPGLCHLVAGMGFKSSPDDEHFMSSYTTLRAGGPGRLRNETAVCGTLESQPCESLTPSFADICYNLYYFEKHGRTTHDPWSCRQSVVSHRYDFEAASSIWFVVQPPGAWESGLEDIWYDKSSHPLALHLRFILAATTNLRPYLNSMCHTLLELVRSNQQHPCVSEDI